MDEKLRTRGRAQARKRTLARTVTSEPAVCQCAARQNERVPLPRHRWSYPSFIQISNCNSISFFPRGLNPTPSSPRYSSSFEIIEIEVARHSECLNATARSCATSGAPAHVPPPILGDDAPAPVCRRRRHVRKRVAELPRVGRAEACAAPASAASDGAPPSTPHISTYFSVRAQARKRASRGRRRKRVGRVVNELREEEEKKRVLTSTQSGAW